MPLTLTWLYACTALYWTLVQSAGCMYMYIAYGMQTIATYTVFVRIQGTWLYACRLLPSVQYLWVYACTCHLYSTAVVLMYRKRSSEETDAGTSSTSEDFDKPPQKKQLCQFVWSYICMSDKRHGKTLCPCTFKNYLEHWQSGLGTRLVVQSLLQAATTDELSLIFQQQLHHQQTTLAICFVFGSVPLSLSVSGLLAKAYIAMTNGSPWVVPSFKSISPSLTMKSLIGTWYVFLSMVELIAGQLTLILWRAACLLTALKAFDASTRRIASVSSCFMHIQHKFACIAEAQGNLYVIADHLQHYLGNNSSWYF